VDQHTTLAIEASGSIPFSLIFVSILLVSSMRFSLAYISISLE
jgi:hypothetical protein